MEFEWDTANLHKLNVINKLRGISKDEIESIFNDPFRIERPNKSTKEERIETIGLSNHNRLLIVIFTKRNGKIRYVTAWEQSRKIS
jgi:uncharacterized protein